MSKGAIAIAATVALLASPGAAANASEESSSASFVQYDFEPATLPDHRLVTVAGEPQDAGGCSFEIDETQISDAVEGEIEFVQQVSLDPQTCESTYAVAAYPLDEVPDVVQEQRLEGDDAALALVAAAEAGGPTLLASGSDYTSLTVEYIDPPGIEVTRTFVRLAWNYATPCVTSKTATHDKWHRTITGWSRTYYNPTSSFVCSRATANTQATFRNGTFCAGQAVYAYHTTTRVYGYPSGASGYSVTQTTGGAVCHTWLSQQWHRIP